MKDVALAGLALLLAACSGRDASLPSKVPAHAVLVTVDTLRADRTGAYGYARARTPNLDALAKDSIRFERAYAHSSLTLPSIASLLTGTLPSEHELYSNHGTLPEHLPTLATQLRAAGFTTAAFLGNYAMRPSRRLQRGFDFYTQKFQSREAVRPHPENLAAQLTDQAIEWLKRRDPQRRIFLWVHYQEPHGPYTPPDFDRGSGGDERVLPRNANNSGRNGIPRYQWLGHGRVAEYSARYDGEIAEVDRQLGRLIEALAAARILDDCILVFTADHGEAFGEEGVWFAHGEGLGEALLRVPLLVRLPGRSPAVRSDVVRLIDVVPTMLEQLGVDAGAFGGKSLLQDVGDRRVVAQAKDWRSLRDGGVEIRQQGDQPAVLRGAAHSSAEDRDALRAKLAIDLQRLAPPRPASRPESLSTEETQALRALGYIE